MLSFSVNKQHDVLPRNAAGYQRIDEDRVPPAFEWPIRGVRTIVRTNRERKNACSLWIPHHGGINAKSAQGSSATGRHDPP